MKSLHKRGVEFREARPNRLPGGFLGWTIFGLRSTLFIVLCEQEAELGGGGGGG